jgi:hypothetical protein
MRLSTRELVERSVRAPSEAATAGRGMPWLVWILVAALMLRVAYSMIAWASAGTAEVFYSPDSPGYVALAEGLASEGAFRAAGMPGMALTRTPGYPLFLVPAVLTGATEPVTIALQILLSLLTLPRRASAGSAIGGSS